MAAKVTKQRRVRGIGKNAIMRDVRMALVATTLGEKLKACEIDLVSKVLVHIIRQRVVSGDRVVLAGFGTFFLSERKGRIAKLQGNAPIQVPPHRVMRFKAASSIRDHINGRGVLTPMQIPEDMRIFVVAKKRKPASKGKSKRRAVAAKTK